MPQAPKQHRPAHARVRKPWQHAGPDLRAGFRGRNRQDAKLRVYVQDAGCCRACGKLCTLASSHLDHIVPLPRGGTHDDDNLQTLCLKCSHAKTAREHG